VLLLGGDLTTAVIVIVRHFVTLGSERAQRAMESMSMLTPCLSTCRSR
jgi:hypothetical protein